MANHIRAEIEVSPLYGQLQALAQSAEDLFCKAAKREHDRSRHHYGRRQEFSAEELLAEAILELIGSPEGVMGDEVEAIVSRLGEREQSEAA